MPRATKQTALEEESRYTTSPEARRDAFRKIVGYAKPHRFTFLFIFICTLFGISSDLLQPYLMKVAIDNDLTNARNDLHFLFLIAGIYLGLSVISLVFTYIQNNLLQYAGQNIVARIRKDLFHHISTMSMSFFDKNAIGSLVTNESSDTETISQFFTQVMLSMMRDGVMLIMIIVLMFKLDVKLAEYSLVLIPIIGGIAVGFRPVLRKTYQQSRTQLSRLIAFLAENLSGMSLIQAFHQEEEQVKRYSEQNQRYLKANMREVRSNVFFNRSFDLLGNLSVAFIAWVGGMAVFHHMINFGVLYAFISYIRQFFGPINTITQQWNTLQSTIVSMDRLWRIFSTQPEVQDAADEQLKVIELANVAGAIDYNHVRFGYTQGIDVIHDIDLHIKPGEMVGIVGATGAGKSSIMNLLTRFYDVKSGSICVDGIDVRKMPQDLLHRMIGLVQQEPFLYSGSIVDNVRLFNPDISREEVIQACIFVGVDQFINRLQNGYDTKLSERGSGLSAGERQLLSFARIVVFSPKILILDEATANLDSHTEQMVQDALKVVSTGRTTLVIAHRLSTIMHADRIIVMKLGNIVEQGTHQQLLDQRGYYQELYLNSQRKEEVIVEDVAKCVSNA
ncbi:MAG: transporter [Bacilli bacterium]|nr:transporter [Bacilli bacterium]